MGFAQTKQEQISIHAPREGSDCVSIHIILTRSDFNPRSPRGERLTQAAFGAESLSHFNPRSPRGERRSAILSPFASPRFQSTLPARGATCKISNGEQAAEISIHAPREGSDQLPCRMAQASRDFNPRSPRGERRTIAQATEPTRNFNPRSPRGERPPNDIIYSLNLCISIHAPREGSDSRYCTSCITAKLFQSTLPARGATL